MTELTTFLHTLVTTTEDGMEHYRVDDLDEQRRAEEEPWLEFQRSESMSTGLYVLAAGQPDEQVPHQEDEVYVVVSGNARFVTPDRSVQVEPGDVLFVPAREEHRFTDVTEDLRLVVVFAPPETLEEAPSPTP